MIIPQFQKLEKREAKILIYIDVQLYKKLKF